MNVVGVMKTVMSFILVKILKRLFVMIVMRERGIDNMSIEEYFKKVEKKIEDMSDEKFLESLKEVGLEDCPDSIDKSSIEDFLYLHDILLKLFDGEYILMERFSGTLFLDVYTKLSANEAFRRKNNFSEFIQDIYTKSEGKIVVDIMFLN